MTNHRPNQGHEPRVCIGMPVYNGERYLEKALDALLAQSFADFSLVISDNASTDRTGEICQAYAARDPRIRYVRQPSNIGALANFAFVLDCATAEFFTWAACDDEWDRDWLEKLLEAVQLTGCGAAFGQLVHIDDASALMRHPANGAVFPYQGPRLWRRIKYFMQFECNGKANPIYSLFRRSHLAGLDLASYKYDYFIVFEIVKRCEFASCASTRIYKRIHCQNDGGSRVRASLGNRLARGIVAPIEWGIVLGYLRASRGSEALLLAFFLPAKFAYSMFERIRNLPFFVSRS